VELSKKRPTHLARMIGQLIRDPGLEFEFASRLLVRAQNCRQRLAVLVARVKLSGSTFATDY
jgi:hypothetical protein